MSKVESPLVTSVFANSDSENRAYLDGAIDAAWRAVNEQLGNA